MIEIRLVLPLSPEDRAALSRLLNADVSRDWRAGLPEAANPGAPGPSPADEPSRGSTRDGAAGASRESVPSAAPPAPPLEESAAAPAARVARYVRDNGQTYRTPEREAMLAREWPGAATLRALHGMLSALPGSPLPPSPTFLYRWADSVGLGERPGRPARTGATVRGWAARRPAAPWKTEARAAFMREHWPVNPSLKAIKAGLAGLPGPALPESDSAFYGFGLALGLVRPAMQSGAPNAARGLEAARARVAYVVETVAGAEPVGPLAPAIQVGPAMSRPIAAAGEVIVPAAEVKRILDLALPPLPPLKVRVPPALPAPAGDGKIYASFALIKAWAASVGIDYDGGNMDAVNKRRGGKALFVQDDSADG